MTCIACGCTGCLPLLVWGQIGYWSSKALCLSDCSDALRSFMPLQVEPPLGACRGVAVSLEIAHRGRRAGKTQAPALQLKEVLCCLCTSPGCTLLLRASLSVSLVHISHLSFYMQTFRCPLACQLGLDGASRGNDILLC